MNRSAKGRRLEHRSRRLLESEGYSVVRSAASRGPFDLVGFRADAAVLVQVRAGRWPSSADLASLAAFPAPAGVRRLVHRWQPRREAPDVREVGA